MVGTKNYQDYNKNIHVGNISVYSSIEYTIHQIDRLDFLAVNDFCVILENFC